MRHESWFTMLFGAIIVLMVVFLVYSKHKELAPCYDACERDGMVYAHHFENHCFCREPRPIMPLVEIDL